MHLITVKFTSTGYPSYSNKSSHIWIWIYHDA